MPEVERVGPVSFTLDSQGAIYVCDSVNQCVKKYDPQGQFLGTVASNVYANHLAIDNDGTIYARLNRGRVAVFRNGQQQESFQVPRSLKLVEGYEQSIAWQRDSEATSKAGWIALTGPDQMQFRVARTSAGSRSEVFSADQIERQAGVAAANQQLYRTRRVSGQQGQIEAFSASGEPLPPISIPMEETLGAVIFKGSDLKGRLYVEVERLAQDGWVTLEIRVYSPGGDLLESFELPNQYYTTIYRRTFLKPDGSIIQMQTRPEGVVFTQWK